jgi:hypothetical protein
LITASLGNLAWASKSEPVKIELIRADKFRAFAFARDDF